MKDNSNGGSAAADDIDQVKEDIAALKRDLAALVGTLKDAAEDSTGEAFEELSGRARTLYEQAAAQGERSAKAVGRQVEAQPVLSLLIAFGVGFVVSRLLSR